MDQALLDSPSSSPSGPPFPAGRFARARCGLGALAWSLVFVALWLGAPTLGKWLGLAWFALGVLWPAGYYFSLALALPWFGNSPGGPHHLYLLEMGLMGLVARHLASRAIGLVAPRRNTLDRWIKLFVAVTWLGLLHSLPWLRCELLYPHYVYRLQHPNVTGFFSLLKDWTHTLSTFFFSIYNQEGTSHVFSLQVVLKLTLTVGLYTALRDHPWSAARIRRWFEAALAMLAAVAVMGWLNYLFKLPLGWWRTVNPSLQTRFGFARLETIFWHPNWLAQYLVALAPAALTFALTSQRRDRQRILMSLAILFTVTQLFTFQRIGLIGLASGYGIVILLTILRDSGIAHLRRCALPRGVSLLGCGALGLSLLLLSPALRHHAGEMLAGGGRIANWRKALGMVNDSPLGGIGSGNFAHVVADIFPTNDPYALSENVTVHNLYLHILAERGISGLVPFLMILGGIIGGLAQALRRPTGDLMHTHLLARQTTTRPLKIAILGGLVAFALDGLTQYIFYVRVIEILFWLLVAWAAGFGAVGPRPPVCSRRSTYQWAAFVAVLMLAQLLGARWVMLVNLNEIYVDGIPLQVGPREVEIPVPPGEHRMRLRLGCADPTADHQAVVLTVTLDGHPLRQLAFSKSGCREVLLELPGNAPEKRHLAVSASRTWSPWGRGLRTWPVLEMGVLYERPPAVLSPIWSLLDHEFCVLAIMLALLLVIKFL